MQNKKKELQVWWVPQVPMKGFIVKVDSVVEGKKLLNILADYDTFQFENRVKPDYSNAGGLQEFDGKEWICWESENGDSIDELTLEELKSL